MDFTKRGKSARAGHRAGRQAFSHSEATGLRNVAPGGFRRQCRESGLRKRMIYRLLFDNNRIRPALLGGQPHDVFVFLRYDVELDHGQELVFVVGEYFRA